MPGNGGSSSSSSSASPSDPRRYPSAEGPLSGLARATVVRARVLRSSLPVPVRRRARRDRSDPPRRPRSALCDDSLDPRARVQPNLGNYSSDYPSNHSPSPHTDTCTTKIILKINNCPKRHTRTMHVIMIHCNGKRSYPRITR